ncbi:MULTISPECIES: EamA family transporter [Amycolatopsis]|uniref:EamA domain-containing protein n=1 Tax=Amycolatopsis albidoflavus TaxID=102226 RepID=A0ABW5HS32_9PSEU
MIAVVLGALAALGWGAADFLGGRASRSASAVSVVTLAQIVTLPLVAVCLAVGGIAFPTPVTFLWSAAAGLSGLAGLVLLYRLLAAEGAAVAVPVAAMVTALVPLVIGLVVENAPSPLALVGGCCAVGAAFLVSMVAREDRRGVFVLRTMGLSALSGLLLGLQLAFIAAPGPVAGLWPLAGARLASVACGAVIAGGALRRGSGVGVRWRLVLAAGLLDTGGFGFYLFALGHGLLSVVGPLVALAPAATLGLALAIDRERLGRCQMAGLLLGAGALILTSL